ncbi:MULTISPECIES: AAA family ATPase [unclassified Microbacterium]|uniref:AAA family ATPase n=1 Tax=unclassified Microbacterium TaxID=2609290 RepID=UPI000EA8E255|nr:MULTISPECIES: AAA family ATPase [unclassified Microbacterium]MBT2484927.1 hypothetical protein [Microbacterium sp. ISL-108]RKN67787.1 hypothetical protein D7252_09430 [Microbacterium sp. CGR2]
MDVLRLAGVPGVGKSAVAWAVAQHLAQEGVPLGYVDIDQLGMCYPAPPDDPDRWVMKETALARLAAQFHRTGVERLVVSGVAEPILPPATSGHPTVSLWLDADEATRRERLAARRWPTEQLDATLAVGTEEARTAHPSWTRVDTDGRSLGETVHAVLELAAPVPRAIPTAVSEDDFAPRAGVTGRVIWITGPRCAGSSSIGWAMANTLWGNGQRAGFVDVAQLGFVWNVGQAIAVRNAAEVQGLFAAAGARIFIAVAPFEIEPDAVEAAFPGAEVAFIRLDADDRSRRDRALQRARGDGGALLAGDDLIGAPPPVIDEVVAADARERPTPVRPGERIVDTSGLSVSEVMVQVRALVDPRRRAMPD